MDSPSSRELCVSQPGRRFHFDPVPWDQSLGSSSGPLGWIPGPHPLAVAGGSSPTQEQVLQQLEVQNISTTWRPLEMQTLMHSRGQIWLTECLPRTMDGGLLHCIEGSDQNHPQEEEMQKGKMVVWGGLTNSWEEKRSERQKRKGKIYSTECRVPKNSKEI